MTGFRTSGAVVGIGGTFLVLISMVLFMLPLLSGNSGGKFVGIFGAI